MTFAMARRQLHGRAISATKYNKCVRYDICMEMSETNSLDSKKVNNNKSKYLALILFIYTCGLHIIIVATDFFCYGWISIFQT